MQVEQLHRLSSDARTQIVRTLAARFPNDPLAYSREVLGITPTHQQQQIAEALMRPPYRVLIRSANNLGKTHALACLCSWWYDSFDPSVVLATAPTQRSVRDLLFKELRTLRPFPYDWSPKDTRLQSKPDHFCHGFTARDEDSFKGQHAGRLLIVFDEAVGVDRPFWTATETMFVGEGRHGWLAAYNPTDVTSYAYKAEASGQWSVVHLSALDHPNILAELRGEPPPIPSAIRLSRVLDRIAAECEDLGTSRAEGDFEFPIGSGHYYKPLTPDFEVQVLGRWPSVAFDALFSPTLWEQALHPSVWDRTRAVQIGCDVARFGKDKTAFAVRQGINLIHLEKRQGWNTRQIADRCRELCHTYAPPGINPRQVRCLIDDTGGYGSGVVDYPDGYQFIGVNAAETASDPTKFGTRRTELWCLVRSALDQHAFRVSAVQHGRELLDELREDYLGVRYSLDKRGRRMMEGKLHTRERTGRSPDLADAVNLAWYIGN